MSQPQTPEDSTVPGTDAWKICGEPVPLRWDVVQLWRARLSEAPDVPSPLTDLLPRCEQQQADRYRHEPTRRQYLLGRTLLRTILAAQLGQAPSSIEIHFASRGKPRLAGATHEIQFNLSHSGDLVMLALAKAMRLGIDVERHRMLPRRDQIAAGILSPQELQQYNSLSEANRQQAFFAVWTRKEAIIKASGEGMSFPLTDLEVSLPPHDAQLLRFGELAGENLPWRLCDINCPSGYTAALATSASPAALELRHWRLGVR